ncbi:MULTISPECIES: spore coat protein [unclassified Clostridium]|uniref:spore coat protein n=1 Tax=unclassified Clostridium TaxID=2614128 RepID=UPI000297C264|nr:MULTISPECIES: spore coat protein [unclassified Clostridium]EKQ55579.1 MAG: coat F domain-containing protein [Clostridium sp. Maddingley MBC34-26]
MSFLDALLGNDDSSLSDKDIALDMVKDSKFAVTSLSAAAAEAVNPELREMLRGQLDKAVTEHFELSDIVINKGWYPAQDQPMEQLKNEYENSQSLS